MKAFTADQVAKKTARDDCWLIIDGSVYDVSKFLDEHPGGEEVILEQAGQDASEAFEEIGHSDDAKGMLKNMLVGTVEGGSEKKKDTAAAPAKKASVVPPPNNNGMMLALVPLVAIVAFIAYKFVGSQAHNA